MRLRGYDFVRIVVCVVLNQDCHGRLSSLLAFIAMIKGSVSTKNILSNWSHIDFRVLILPNS